MHYRIAVRGCHEYTALLGPTLSCLFISIINLLTSGRFSFISAKIVSPSEATFLYLGRSYQPPIMASPCFTLISPRKNTSFGWFEPLQTTKKGKSRHSHGTKSLKSWRVKQVLLDARSCLKSGVRSALVAPAHHAVLARNHCGYHGAVCCGLCGRMSRPFGKPDAV